MAARFSDASAARVRQIGKAVRWLYKCAGVARIIMGLAIMTGQLLRFANWRLGGNCVSYDNRVNHPRHVPIP